MKDILIVVDMQNDFINGALGSEQAEFIVPAVARKIKHFDGTIFVTMDTHYKDYLDTLEGQKLPVIHCIDESDGWKLNEKIEEALKDKDFEIIVKYTFASIELAEVLQRMASKEELRITLVGLCTDICVASNALLLRAYLPNTVIQVAENCCAGVTKEKHEAALETMRSCQIDVI